MMRPKLRFWELGRVDYERAYALQRLLVERHHQPQVEPNKKNVVLLVEHPPVYTVGIRSGTYTEEEEQRLRKLGADFQRTDRGGLITFHGPGQLVAYPVLDLRSYNLGVRTYVCALEKAVVATCRGLGVEGVTTSDAPNETGVWVGDAKVCAIGVRASRQVTSHGLALNCDTDLGWYGHIVPCGLKGKRVTSLTELLGGSEAIGVRKVAPLLLAALAEQLGCVAANFSHEEQMEILGRLPS